MHQGIVRERIGADGRISRGKRFGAVHALALTDRAKAHPRYSLFTNPPGHVGIGEWHPSYMGAALGATCGDASSLAARDPAAQAFSIRCRSGRSIG